MIAVSMPWYRVPADLFERAVRSALAQDVRDIRLVIIGDGEPAPIPVRDPRIVTYTLPENRGPYFAHQALILANPFDWFAVQDADDWVDSDHLATLLGIGASAVSQDCVWWHDIRTNKNRRGYKRLGRWHYGLFRTERLRAIGGYDAGRRIANDNHMLRTLAMTGRLASSKKPTYHRMKRRGSLTSAPGTSMQSPARKAERARNKDILEACRGRSIGEVRAYRESLVPPEVHEALDVHAKELRILLEAS